MNPVIGLDISKGRSDGQAFLDKNQPFGKGFQFDHTQEGFVTFLHKIQEVERESGRTPVIILEATGHYHLPVTDFLEQHELTFIVLNPLISYQARKVTLRKVKTDQSDAYKLAALYYKEEFEPFKKRNVQLLNIRALAREHDAITKMYVQTQLRFQAILDQVFPGYEQVFTDL
ncbi:IS110 family transposase, partial [Brevibacillus sp. SYP-B805]|uniref:IS110 family transposase n=1 Tax=Brevibacillus sp. SYP-B805 TaxID=1578199 RepID=UPI0013ECCAF0